VTLNIEQQGEVFCFTGLLNRDTLMLYSPFKLLNSVSERINFDFSGLENIDTAGLAWLLQQLAWAKQHDIEISLCNVPKQLLSLADVTAVRPLLPISN
tara:strand:+ start:225 stop:518 length:294 start_codon:yes stop_codon:yes gene_type:complete